MFYPCLSSLGSLDPWFLSLPGSCPYPWIIGSASAKFSRAEKDHLGMLFRAAICSVVIVSPCFRSYSRFMRKNDESYIVSCVGPERRPRIEQMCFRKDIKDTALRNSLHRMKRRLR